MSDLDALPRLRLADDGAYIHEDAEPVGTVDGSGGHPRAVYLSDENRDALKRHLDRREKEAEAERQKAEAEARRQQQAEKPSK